MRVACGAAVLLFGCATLLAQTPAPAMKQTPGAASLPPTPAQPAPAQPAQVSDSGIGFSYSLPSDWALVPPPPPPKTLTPYPQLMGGKRGNACIEVAFTARHGRQSSTVIVTVLPFACYGQTLKPRDLANLGSGAAQGMKQTYRIKEPVEGNYTLGDHALWIERAKGTPKGHPNRPFIFETVCTVLAKGAVCWQTVAADWSSLRDFEQSPVTLEGTTYASLVPERSFVSDPK